MHPTHGRIGDMEQQKYWNEFFSDLGQVDLSGHSQFAEEVAALLPKKSKILELGCGLGRDAVYFAHQGFTVSATDFSPMVIAQNNQRNKQTNLTFSVCDISKSLPFLGESFNAVYANLSLHYFTDTVTKQVFENIQLVLRPQGLLCFQCKSVDDPLYGKGTRIEKDVYYDEGKTRHFFSINYAKECLANMYVIQRTETGTENFYDKPSAYVKVIAQKV